MSLKDKIHESLSGGETRERSGSRFSPTGDFFNRAVIPDSNVSWGVLLLVAVACYAIVRVVMTLVFLFG